MSADTWVVLTNFGSRHVDFLKNITPESLNLGRATDRALSIAMKVLKSCSVIIASEMNSVSLMTFCLPDAMSLPNSSATPSASVRASLSRMTRVERPSGKSATCSLTSASQASAVQTLDPSPFRMHLALKLPRDGVNPAEPTFCGMTKLKEYSAISGVSSVSFG